MTVLLITFNFTSARKLVPGAIVDPPAIVWNPVKGVFLIVVRGTNNTIWAMEY
jgi:hypothetical protein